MVMSKATKIALVVESLLLLPIVVLAFVDASLAIFGLIVWLIVSGGAMGVVVSGILED